MEKEKFNVVVNGTEFTIINYLASGQTTIVYEVWKESEFLFKLEPGGDPLCGGGWVLTKEYAGQLGDKELASEIGEAIEHHDS